MSEALSVRVLASVWISFQPVWDSLFQGADELLHQVLSQTRVLGAVGLDEALVDAPGLRNRNVALVSEQGLETPGLGVGEQAGPGV